MKTIKKLTAILSCIAVAGSLAAVPAFAEVTDNGDGTVTESVTIEAMANACGWDNTDSLNKDRCAINDYLTLGGTDTSNVIFKAPSSNYPITGGANIAYNEKGTKRDANVIYLRFNLPADVSETDKYELSIKSNGATRTDRAGDLEVYAGVVDMSMPVITTNTTPGAAWTTRVKDTTEGGITWNTRPVVNSITELGTISAASTATNTWDISSILEGQKAGNVTIALMGKLVSKDENGSVINAEGKYDKNVTLTRTYTASEEPETPTFTASVVENSFGTVNGTIDYADTKASYFLANITSNRDNAALNSLSLKVGETDKGTKNFVDPVIILDKNAGVYFGIIVNNTTITDANTITMTAE